MAAKNVVLNAKLVNVIKTTTASTQKVLGREFCFTNARQFSLTRSNNIELPTRRAKLVNSYYHGTSPFPLSDLTLGKALQQTVEKYPDRECLVFCEDNQRLTFSEFMIEVDKLAAGLLKLGLKRGDRIGIWGPSTRDWVVTQFATGRIGLILVNVNPAYQTSEMEYALRKVGCKAIISDVTYKTQNYYDMIRETSPEIDFCKEGQLRSHRLPDLTTVIMMGEKHFPGTYRFSDVINAGGPKEIAQVHNCQSSLQMDDPINIQFTSGTTGHPKGATLTHHNIINNALLIGQRIGFDDDHDRVLCQVPLYHCFGMVAGTLCMAVHGQTMVFAVAGYDPAASVRTLIAENCTTIFGTPTMYIDVCSHAESINAKFTRLTKGVMAGSPCPIEVIHRVDRVLGTKVQVAYGSTETSPVTCFMFRNDPDEKRTTTVGKAIANTENRIVDVDGKIVPVNTAGEVQSRGYCVMVGYWNDKEKTAEAIDDQGWYHTGDIGEMDEEGYVKVIGRIKDMIIRGGENVYPTEVEDFLHTHPKIDDVQVIGLPDKRLGEEVAAWIRVKEGEKLTENEIKDYCKGKISHFKIPKYIKFVTDFPITVTRKVQKFKMREEHSKELGL
ncbi:medium-chain acyl-CoA ligase ACSF2, mitochondrial-like [Ciona intestinalis]